MSSIEDGISCESLANEVRMLRASHEGSFLLVEGSGDKKFLSSILDFSSCEVVVCLGREKLLGVVSELGSEGFQGVLGFADRDFSNITGYPDYEGEVVYTDENDLEMMLLCSGALDKVLWEYGKSDIARSIAREGKDIRNMIYESARVVGTLRLLSQERSWSLRFDGMKYKFVDSRSYRLDLMKTVRQVMARTPRSIGLTPDAIEFLVVERMSRENSAKELCCGHDCVRVLGRALKKLLGNTNKFDNEQGARELEEALRMAYESEQFRSTGAYCHIRRWEEVSGFKILR